MPSPSSLSCSRWSTRSLSPSSRRWLPLYLLTFGLFALVTNSLLFALTGWLSTSLGIPMTTGGFWSCLAGAVITSVVASLVSGVLHDKKDKRD